ncbi:MAG: sensor histidine kinase [Clostridiales bacterium]|nr:sensor histidine kinase [Clostridiales bacterium]
MSKQKKPILKIQHETLKMLITIAAITTVITSSLSIFVSIRSEEKHLDQNIQNISQAIAGAEVVQDALSTGANNSDNISYQYIDSLKKTLSNIDLISVVDKNNIRRYHSNNKLIGTKYDGTIPKFKNTNTYVTSDVGPSGSQRRSYSAIYDSSGHYMGFVIAGTLNDSINRIILNTVFIYLVCVLAIIMCALVISSRFSKRIKKLLLGYEPDTFSAMFSIRENILESLEEGILAVNAESEVIYINSAAQKILRLHPKDAEGRQLNEIAPYLSIKNTIVTGEKHFGISVNTDSGTDIIFDSIPVITDDEIVGALCLLRDRTEYTQMMEELSGVKYMVESMRANNHDFINKLHVVLGLIQMNKNEEACEYITNVTSIQQYVLNNIMKNFEDSSVAALLIGKYARASELNIHFALENGSHLMLNDISLPSSDLVTIIGNLIDNAMDSIDEKNIPPKEITVGIFTQPHALLISVDDTGIGIKDNDKESIFSNGFSTKGEKHGTGLYIVKNLVNQYNGEITFESDYGVGTSFTVTLTDEGGI